MFLHTTACTENTYFHSSLIMLTKCHDFSLFFKKMLFLLTLKDSRFIQMKC